MKTKQTIAVIGNTGKMQTTLLKGLSRGNYRLLLCSNEDGQMLSLTEEIRTANVSADVEIIQCTVNATWEADIILSTIPRIGEKEMAATIKEVACQKILVSIGEDSNNITNGAVNLTAIKRATDELQNLLPHSKVVKVVSSSVYTEATETVINGNTQNAIVAGEDKEAVNTVSELLSSAGFNSIITTAIEA
jgi:8-hydroxy-5-deazaflavin:NADPH oxidoreductase